MILFFLMGIMLGACANATQSDVINGNSIGVTIRAFAMSSNQAFPAAQAWCEKYGKNAYYRGQSRDHVFGCK